MGEGGGAVARRDDVQWEGRGRRQGAQLALLGLMGRAFWSGCLLVALLVSPPFLRFYSRLPTVDPLPPVLQSVLPRRAGR